MRYQICLEPRWLKIEFPFQPADSVDVKIFWKEDLLYETRVETRPDMIVWVGTNTKLTYDPLYRFEVKTSRETFTCKLDDLRGKVVYCEFETPALGDTLAWLPSIVRFAKRTQARVYVTCPFGEVWSKLGLPIRFEHPEQYFLRIPFGVYDEDCHVRSWRDVSLQEIASDILGLPPQEEKLDLRPLAGPQQIESPYACIGPCSTLAAKEWNYENGWQELVDWLNSRGFKVVWIAKEPCFLRDVIDKSGELPLEDRITDLVYCDFFVGLPAGLSWLAWCCDAYVFMITGFSYSWCEFQSGVTRIRADGVCRGCFNMDFPFTREWTWCPMGNNYECNTSITPQMVIEAIEKTLPIIKSRDSSPHRGRRGFTGSIPVSK